MMFRGGRARTEIDGNTIELPTDSFVIIPPGKTHTNMNAGDTRISRYWCHFDWVYAGPHGDTPDMTFMPGTPIAHLFRPAPDFVPPLPMYGRIPDPAAAYDLHERLADSVTRSPHEFLMSRGILLQLLIELLDTTSREQRELRTDLPSRIRQTLDRVAFDTNAPLICELLHSLGCSYEHACRVFRSTYGVTPLQYIHTKRIARAKELLRRSDLRIMEIARQCGFQDPTYFTVVFRKFSGRAPSDFRNHHRQYTSPTIGPSF